MNDSLTLQHKLEATLHQLEVANKELSKKSCELEDAHQKLKAAEKIIAGHGLVHQQDNSLTAYATNLERVFSSTQEGILLVDTQATAVLLNKTFTDFLLEYAGITAHVGMSFSEMLFPERREIAMSLFDKAIRGETTFTEGAFHTRLGTIVHSLRYQPVWQADVVTHVMISSYDITEKKAQEDFMRQAEEDYLKSQHKFKALVEHTDDIFSLIDDRGFIQYASPSFTRILGYSPQEIATLRRSDIIHPEDMQLHADVMQNVKSRPGQLMHSVVRARHRKGHWLWMQGVSINLLNVKSIEGIIINYRDITAQRTYQQTITAVARELTGIIENSGVPIFGVDEHGNINEWNAVTAALTNYARADVLGMRWVENFIEPHYRDSVTAVLAKVLKGGTVNNFELPIFTQAQQPITLLLNASPRYDAQNEIKGVIMVAQNISELIDYRQGLERMVQDRTRELNEVLQKEKALVDLKSKFVSMASHEFRIPLANIARAALQVSSAEKLSDSALQKLDDIQQQVDHMRFLLEDVLTVGKADAGKVLINVAPVDVPTFFQAISDEVAQSSGHTHKVALSVSISREAREVVQADSRMLRIIVLNLLTNAIKFSPSQKEVSLLVGVDNRSLTIEVRDEGLGIPEVDQAKLFTAFHRASNVNEIQGTGLGLSIVGKTVDLLNGTIHMESRVHKGTTFQVIIPVA